MIYLRKASSMPNKLTQHEIRQHAVQALFTLEMRPEVLPADVVNYALDGEQPENLEEVIRLVSGLTTQKEKLDGLISQYLTSNWTLSRLTTMDKTLLRLGAYEISATDVPDVVALDETLNLAHDFSDETAVKLINGILTNLIKK
jgi:N utilization substance protein B